jgi:hypothetical protein
MTSGGTGSDIQAKIGIAQVLLDRDVLLLVRPFALTARGSEYVLLDRPKLTAAVTAGQLVLFAECWRDMRVRVFPNVLRIAAAPPRPNRVSSSALATGGGLPQAGHAAGTSSTVPSRTTGPLTVHGAVAVEMLVTADSNGRAVAGQGGLPLAKSHSGSPRHRRRFRLFA